MTPFEGNLIEFLWTVYGTVLFIWLIVFVLACMGASR